ncbi:MAG: type II secretion system protein GspM [Myxococcota bacterium]
MATVSVRTGPMAVVERQLEALSPRDRKLLVGLVLFAVIFGAGGFWWLLHGMLADKASRVRTAKDTYAQVQQLEQEYRAADARFSAQKSRLEQYADQPVSAWIEDLADKHELKQSLSAVQQTTAEQVGDILSTRYTIELKHAPQEPLYRFLYELETSGFPARVEQSNFKVTTVKKEKTMDVSLDVVVLSLGEGS